MFFDTHAHYDDKAFDEDRDSLLAALPEAGVTLVIDPGCDVKSSRAAIELAARYEHVYAAVGIHPEELGDFTEENLNEIAHLARDGKCVAIGEIGLDYYWDDTYKAEQKELFRRQIELALELSKPIIVHDREAAIRSCAACSTAFPVPRRWRRNCCVAAGTWDSMDP